MERRNREHRDIRLPHPNHDKYYEYYHYEYYYDQYYNHVVYYHDYYHHYDDYHHNHHNHDHNDYDNNGWLRMGLNVGAVKKALVRLLDLLFESEDLVESVTYKLSTGVVSGTGRERNTSGYTDYTLSAINVEKNYARMLITDTGFSTAKLTYLLRTEGAPDGMSARDKIVCGTKVRQVLEVRNYFGVAYGLVLEGLQ